MTNASCGIWHAAARCLGASEQGEQHIAGTCAFFALDFAEKVHRLRRESSGEK